MMKRTLPLLLLLALACAAGCEPKKDSTDTNANMKPNSNSNVGNRQTDANVNANVGVNANTDTTIAPTLHTKEDKSVAIIITEDGSGKLQFLVSPYKITLSKKKNQKLRFHVFNNTEVDLKEVVITFVGENPFDGAFKVGDIKAGHDKSSSTYKIRDGAAVGTYTYHLKALDNASPDPVVVLNSPEVEIAT
jgi:hypothetical protein